MTDSECWLKMLEVEHLATCVLRVLLSNNFIITEEVWTCVKVLYIQIRDPVVLSQ